MIKVSVLYPFVEGMRFDMAYYVGQHLPLVQRLVGDALLRYEVDEGLSGAAPGSSPTYRAAVHMYYASTDSFYAAFGPHGKEIMKDVANYTDARPLTQISRVVES
jgi:uncharacterized protein (TIGR02118 family)